MKSKILGCLALAVLALGAAGPADALSIAIGQQITNGGFDTNLAGWSTSGTVNRRLGSDTLDNSLGNRGFNNFFGESAFAAIGDISGDAALEPWNSVHSIEQSFALASSVNGYLVNSYTLDVNFRAVFEGRDGPAVTGSLHDTFSVLLYTPAGMITLLSADSSGFPDTFCTTTAGSSNCTSANATFNQQISWNLFTGQIAGLLPGAYTLKFVLSEATDPAGEAWFTNTVAGIDGVSITGTAYVPEPGTLALLGLGLLGLGVSRDAKPRRRHAQRDNGTRLRAGFLVSGCRLCNLINYRKRFLFGPSEQIQDIESSLDRPGENLGSLYAAGQAVETDTRCGALDGPGHMAARRRSSHWPAGSPCPSRFAHHWRGGCDRLRQRPLRRGAGAAQHETDQRVRDGDRRERQSGERPESG